MAVETPEPRMTSSVGDESGCLAEEMNGFTPELLVVMEATVEVMTGTGLEPTKNSQ